ncbi:unnamed protein product [Choristocarpus tenellus]
MRVSVRDLNRHGKAVTSGVLTEKTHFIFRSRSSRIFWLVQISVEMYEFSQDGVLYSTVFIDQFVRKLMGKWKALDVKHSLTVVFFCRTIYPRRLVGIFA